MKVSHAVTCHSSHPLSIGQWRGCPDLLCVSNQQEYPDQLEEEDQRVCRLDVRNQDLERKESAQLVLDLVLVLEQITMVDEP